MRSVADDLRRQTVERVLALSVEDRISLALALGDDDIESYMRASGLDRDAARRQLSLRRHDGRTPSHAASPSQ